MGSMLTAHAWLGCSHDGCPLSHSCCHVVLSGGCHSSCGLASHSSVRTGIKPGGDAVQEGGLSTQGSLDNAGSTSSGGRGFQVRANSDWLIRFESLVGPLPGDCPACARLCEALCLAWGRYSSVWCCCIAT